MDIRPKRLWNYKDYKDIDIRLAPEPLEPLGLRP
jgi:hypothetical protein